MIKIRPSFGGRWVPAVLAAAALAVRALYLYIQYARDPLASSLAANADGAFFYEWAVNIATGHAGLWGGKDVFFIGPLYAYFLAAFHAVGWRSLLAIKIAQGVLDVGSVLLIYDFTRRTFGTGAALVAGGLWAFFLPAVFYAAQVLPVTLDLFLVAAAFWFLACAAAGPRGNYVWAGCAFAFVALDRPNVLLAVGALAVALALARPRPGWRAALAFAAPVVLVVVATAGRNYAVGRDPVVISSQGGINFYIGNGPGADGMFRSLVPGGGNAESLNRDYATATASRYAGRRLRPGEVSGWWFREGFRHLRASPFSAVKLWLLKARFLIGDAEIGLNEDFYFAGVWLRVHRIPWPWFGSLVAFAVVGFVAVMGGRGRPRLSILIAVFVVAYGISVVAFFVTSRYRMPLTPALAALAGAGIYRLYDDYRGRRVRSFAALTAVAVVTAVFAVVPFASPSRTRLFGWFYGVYASQFLAAGDYARAAALYEKAVAYAPTAENGYYALSLAYYQMGQEEKAVAALRRGVERLPDSFLLQYHYALTLIAAGRPAEAVLPLAVAARLRPADGEVWMQLAFAHWRAGDLNAALAAGRRAASLRPEDGAVWRRLGELALAAGSEDEAWEAARRAAAAGAARTPEELMGDWRFAAGDVAGAAAEYETAVALAPTDDTLAKLNRCYIILGHRGRAGR